MDDMEMMSVTWSVLANDSAHYNGTLIHTLVSKVEFVVVQRDGKLSDN